MRGSPGRSTGGPGAAKTPKTTFQPNPKPPSAKHPSKWRTDFRRRPIRHFEGFPGDSEGEARRKIVFRAPRPSEAPRAKPVAKCFPGAVSSGGSQGETGRKMPPALYFDCYWSKTSPRSIVNGHIADMDGFRLDLARFGPSSSAFECKCQRARTQVVSMGSASSSLLVEELLRAMNVLRLSQMEELIAEFAC